MTRLHLALAAALVLLFVVATGGCVTPCCSCTTTSGPRDTFDVRARDATFVEAAAPLARAGSPTEADVKF